MNTSAYQIFWAIATPVKGKATKADSKIAKKNGFVNFGNSFLRHGENVDSLKELCKMQLGKTYNVVIITDKQFSMVDGKTKDFMLVATDLQKEQMFTI